VANRPLKSLANRTRYLKGKSDESERLVAEKVSAVKTFEEGATLKSPREEILYGKYRLVWTGDFPKTVPAGSTPKETGGTGGGPGLTLQMLLFASTGADDGMKLLGRCRSLSSLRATEPTDTNQAIILTSCAGWSRH
jgi:hypothetical protein